MIECLSERAYSLPLTLAMLQRLRAECLAGDVTINPISMASLTAAEARAYFECGGDGMGDGPLAHTPEPATATDPALVALLDEIGAPAEWRALVGARCLDGWLTLACLA